MHPRKADGPACITSLCSSSANTQYQPSLKSFQYHQQNYHHLEVTVTILCVLTPFLSTISVVMVCIAVSTNNWLLTQENMSNPNYNGTGDHEYLPKSTISGLWTLCYTNPGGETLVCSNIEYFPNEEYSPDPNDSTMAIPYTVTKSATFLLLATFLLFLGEFYSLCGHFSHQRRIFTFISGVVFIISGLLMLIGLVMYISIFKAEIGGKLRPKSQLQPAVFTFQYGFSFILYVTGFISTEISGTCAVFLYIYWHQKEWQRKRNELREKLSRPAVLLDGDNVDHIYPACKRHSQISDSLYISPYKKAFLIHNQRDPYSQILDQSFCYRENGIESEKDTIPTSCLKHKNMCHRFLEKSSSDHCNMKKYHNLNGENNQITPSPPQEFYCPWLSVIDSDLIVGGNNLPRDATTNTVSTIADVELDDSDDYSQNFIKEQKLFKFDLDSDSISLPISTNFCNLENSNDVYGLMFESFSKTTPV